MKKKIIYIVILFILNLTFAACGINNDLPPTASSEVSTETLTETTSASAGISEDDNENGFVFMHEGHEFYMGMPEEEIKQYKKDYYAVPYGISTGHRYEFDHFYIDCVPGDLGGGPTLAEMMSFKDASCRTSEGIRIGDSLDQVIDAYKGNDLLIKSYHNYQYWKGNTKMRINFQESC